MVDQIQTRMTAAEFSELPESNTRIELINAEVIVAPSPIDKHQEVLGNLHVRLRLLKLFGVCRLAPADVYLDEFNVVQPDLFWVSSDNSSCHLIDNYWHGAPDLIVEVLSPGTMRRDRDANYHLYEKYGVREYWLVDPEELYSEVYALHEGQFERQGFYGLGEQFVSSVLNGRALSVDSLLKS